VTEVPGKRDLEPEAGGGSDARIVAFVVKDVGKGP